jgi:hypothetical protein
VNSEQLQHSFGEISKRFPRLEDPSRRKRRPFRNGAYLSCSRLSPSRRRETRPLRILLSPGSGESNLTVFHRGRGHRHRTLVFSVRRDRPSLAQAHRRGDDRSWSGRRSQNNDEPRPSLVADLQVPSSFRRRIWKRHNQTCGSRPLNMP